MRLTGMWKDDKNELTRLNPRPEGKFILVELSQVRDVSDWVDDCDELSQVLYLILVICRLPHSKWIIMEI